MRGKYTSRARYLAAKLARVPLRLALRGLVSWRTLRNPQPGYTVLLACSRRLLPMLGVNLRFVARQRSENLKEVLLVIDSKRDEAMAAMEARLRSEYPALPMRFLYYTPLQYTVTHTINWGWAYSWLSWCKGVAETTTRYAILHDFDALLLRDDVFEERYAEVMRRGHEFIGVRFYEGNGVEKTDELVTTFELIFDAAFVRERFRPIEVFNHVAMLSGHSVDFDTFLYAQSRHGTSSVLPVEEEAMVHPSQMICQYTDQQSGRLPAIPTNNLLLIPYYIYVSGDPEPLRRQRRAIDQQRGRVVEFAGKPLDLSKLSAVHAAWISKQAFRVERAVSGGPRDEIREYFEAIESMVSGGRSSGPTAEAGAAMEPAGVASPEGAARR